MSKINDVTMALFDQLFAMVPQPRPLVMSPEQVKIVAHRGFRKHPDILENSLEALQAAAGESLYGVEFDVRWTADDTPVICHDPSPARLFPHASKLVSDVTQAELSHLCPKISTLEEIVTQLKGKIHLFIELKEPALTARRQEILQNTLDSLVPVNDFHIMALNPDFFEKLTFLPPPSFLPIATWNTQALSQRALEKGWAGVSGHYLLLSDQLLGRHHEMGQACGTGFINSKNVLFRELNRGMDWIFTDQPHNILSALDPRPA